MSSVPSVNKSGHGSALKSRRCTRDRANYFLLFTFAMFMIDYPSIDTDGQDLCTVVDYHFISELVA